MRNTFASPFTSGLFTRGLEPSDRLYLPVALHGSFGCWFGRTRTLTTPPTPGLGIEVDSTFAPTVTHCAPSKRSSIHLPRALPLAAAAVNAIPTLWPRTAGKSK